MQTRVGRHNYSEEILDMGGRTKKNANLYKQDYKDKEIKVPKVSNGRELDEDEFQKIINQSQTRSMKTITPEEVKEYVEPSLKNEDKVYDINRIVSNEEFTTDPNWCRFLLDSVISNYDIDYGKSYNSSMLTTSKLNNMIEEFNNSLTKEISKSKQTTPTIEEKIEEYLKLEDIKNKDLKTKVKK